MEVTITVPLKQWEDLNRLIDDKTITLQYRINLLTQRIEELEDSKTLGIFKRDFRSDFRFSSHLVINENFDNANEVMELYIRARGLITIPINTPWYKRIFKT